MDKLPIFYFQTTISINFHRYLWSSIYPIPCRFLQNKQRTEKKQKATLHEHCEKTFYNKRKASVYKK